MPKKYKLKDFEEIRVSDVDRSMNDKNGQLRLNDKWENSAKKGSFIKEQSHDNTRQAILDKLDSQHKIKSSCLNSEFYGTPMRAQSLVSTYSKEDHTASIVVNLTKVESKPSKKPEKDSLNLMKAVIRIQAKIRGYLQRKQYITRQTEAVRTHILKKQVKRKYFTQSEFWETISRLRTYKDSKPLEVRQYQYKCSGAIYEGEWKGGFREGRGKITWPDGASYEGEWKDNRAHGFGTFVHAIGDIYEGQWYRDKACGKGVYKSVNTGGTYNGDWKDDLQHGRGVETWQDGSLYEGEFYLGEKSGFGKQIWPDQSIFIGQWSNNMINGVGRQQWNDKRIYEGEFSQNLMHGYGKFTFSDGKSYEGFYSNDRKHGYGIFSWLNGKRYEGWWTDGKQDGYGILIDKSKKQFGIWKGGSKIKILSEEEAKAVLKNYDQAMEQFQQEHRFMKNYDQLNEEELTMKDKIDRLTFYCPPDYLLRQKQINSVLKNIETYFEKLDRHR